MLCKSQVDITDTEIDELLEKEFAFWFNTYVSNGSMPLKNYSSYIYIYIYIYIPILILTIFTMFYIGEQSFK